MHFISVLVVSIVALHGCVADEVIVHTVYGDVQGVRTDKSQQFLGIPYASPPTGDLRWMDPVTPLSWEPAFYDATVRQPGCPQKHCDKHLPNVTCPLQTSEDCLYLNVWTPLNATNTSSYPVMVFIHGGSFIWGSGSNLMYDGNNLASRGNVILVNINYRLGLLGFLYTGDGDDDAHGNFGLRDQRLALQWVQQNIRNFGGDPNKVTLFGESAGAQSTFLHMMSQKSNGLFRAGIMESNPFAIPYRSKPEALLLTKKVQEILKCKEQDGVKCMKSKSVDEINDAQLEISGKMTGAKLNEYFEVIGPVIDNDEIEMQPMMAAALGRYRKVPVIVGTNTEEGRMFIYSALKRNLTRTEFGVALAILHPFHFEEVEKIYNIDPHLNDYRDALSEVVTDFLLTCATRNVTRNLIKSSPNNSFLYVFDHATVARGGWGIDWFCEGHVCHAAELGFVFQNKIAPGPYTPDEVILEQTILTHWTNFAYTMDPNEGPLSPTLYWPSYAVNKASTLHFQTPSNHLFDSDYRLSYCNFWDSIDYGQT